MRQARAIWMKSNFRGAGIKLMIMHSQIDIRGVWRETGQHKIKRGMRLLRNVMAVLYNGLPDLREDSQHGYQMQKGSN